MLTMQFPWVFFTILCYNHINNYYSFYLSLEFQGRPKGALIKNPRIFWQIFKEKKKKELQLCNFSRVFFANLCYNHINNYYSFLFLRGSSRGARRALYKHYARIFWQIFKEKKKRIVNYAI